MASNLPTYGDIIKALSDLRYLAELYCEEKQLKADRVKQITNSIIIEKALRGGLIIEDTDELNLLHHGK